MPCFAYRAWEASPQHCISPVCGDAAGKVFFWFVVCLFCYFCNRVPGGTVVQPARSYCWNQRVQGKTSFKKNLRLLRKAPKIELKPFRAGPACQWLHNQHGCIVQIQLPSFQPAWAGSPEHSPLGRMRYPLSFFRHPPCEGRHNTGYLWQTHGSSSSQRRTPGREPHFKTWGWLMGVYPSRMKGEHWGFSSVLRKAEQCEASDHSDEEKGVVSQAFFLYVYSEDVVSSMPTENNTHFENSGFELLSLNWEAKPQET